MVSISAVVCTYNRAESLIDAIDSLVRQRLAPGTLFEVVVIDNNSKDRTRGAVESFVTRSPWPVRYFLETNQGIGYARNRGLREAQGDFILFIDDDAVADETWAARMAACLEETQADLAGGKIEPLWVSPRPYWVTENLLGPVVRHDNGPLRKRCTSAKDAFLTCNIGFRKASVDKFGVFDATLGRRGDRWIGGEDFELFERWLSQGAAIYYEPSAIVKHKVEDNRMTPDFYRRWFEDIGVTQAHQEKWKPHYKWSIVPAWRWALLIKAWLRYFWSLISRSAGHVQLESELWWRFQSSYFHERLQHWKAACSGQKTVQCRFVEKKK